MFLPYPELRNVVGSNVPDLRGLFLRGYGGSSSSLGIQQGDAIRNSGTCGTFYAHANANDSRWPTSGVFKSSLSHGSIFHHGYGPTTQQMYRFDLDFSNVMPVANEIRPVNMAVRYFIRARP